MTQSSDTPLDREIAAREAERTDPREILAHEIQSLLRDLSTRCVIDGYQPMVGRGDLNEWSLIADGRKMRVILVELP